MTDDNEHLHLAWLREFPEVEVNILSKGLKAHTAIIAQSGSGKSFTIGRLIEEIAMYTKARIFILDPNADFICSHEINEESWINPNISKWLGGETKEEFKKKWNEININVFSNRKRDFFSPRDKYEVYPIKLDWFSSPAHEQLKVLGLTPHDLPGIIVLHYAIQNVMKSILNERPELSKTKAYREALYQYEDHILEKFGKKSHIMLNYHAIYDYFEIEVAQKNIWKGTKDDSIRDKILKGFNNSCSITVIDLPGLDGKKEEMLVAKEALKVLWNLSRETWAEGLNNEESNRERVPTFIVIDEAHNLSPAETHNLKTEIEIDVCERISRIATEGRKYGLFLIIVTQRPNRVNPTVITQCDNLCIQRLNNRNDLRLIESTFGMLPLGWASQATELKIGEAILCGKFIKNPVISHIAARRCAEGGANLTDEWCKKA